MLTAMTAIATVMTHDIPWLPVGSGPSRRPPGNSRNADGDDALGVKVVDVSLFPWDIGMRIRQRCREPRGRGVVGGGEPGEWRVDGGGGRYLCSSAHRACSALSAAKRSDFQRSANVGAHVALAARSARSGSAYGSGGAEAAAVSVVRASSSKSGVKMRSPSKVNAARAVCPVVRERSSYSPCPSARLVETMRRNRVSRRCSSELNAWSD